MLQSVQLHKADIHCDFPSPIEGGKNLRVLLDPMPSLKDQPGLYRVILRVEGNTPLKAAAQPVNSTPDRDVVIRAKTAPETTLSLGMRDDGTAALTLTNTATTRIGACTGLTPHINRWLPS